MMKAKISGPVWEKVKKNKYLLIVVVVGIILIILPIGGGNTKSDHAAGASAGLEGEPPFSLTEQEARIADALGQIDGAGRVTVVLTLKSGSEQVLATDKRSSVKTGEGTDNESDSSETAVIVSAGSSAQTPVLLKFIYPQYLGALVVAEGADDPAVKLELTRAVSGLIGLGTDKITVTKMKT